MIGPSDFPQREILPPHDNEAFFAAAAIVAGGELRIPHSAFFQGGTHFYAENLSVEILGDSKGFWVVRAVKREARP